MPPKKTLQRNIKIYYSNDFFNGLMAISAPIIVIFQLQSIGLSLAEVLIGEAFFALAILLSEVPTGVIADRVGRKKSLLIAESLVAFSFIYLALANSFLEVVFVQIVIGIGMAFASGANQAILYDTLKVFKKEKDYKRIYGRARTIQYTTSIITNILGGFLATLFGLFFPILMGGFFAILSVLNLTLFIEPPRGKKRTKSLHEHTWKAFVYIWKHPLVRYTIIFSMILGVGQKLSFHTLNPYWDLMGVPVALFGVALACHNLLAALFSHYAHWFIEKLGDVKSLLLILSISCGTFAIMSGFNLGLVGAMLFPSMFQIVRAIFPIATDDMVNRTTESHHRATVLSMKSFLMNGAQMLLLPVFGYAADILSLLSAFMWMAGIMFIIGLVALLHLYKVPAKFSKS